MNSTFAAASFTVADVSSGQPAVQDRAFETVELGRPQITVIIPVYNGEPFIREAIESALCQTYQPLEVLLVDDGSTDRTLEIADEYSAFVRVIRQPNRGHASARNIALQQAQGDWIAMLDADDRWAINKLKKQIPYTADYDVIYTAALNFEDSHRVDNVTFQSRPLPQGDVFDQLLVDNFLTHSSLLLKKQAVLDVGGYDESLRTTCDWDLWLRMSAAGYRFAGCPEALTEYRWRATSNSRNHQRTCGDRLMVLNRALQSERGKRVPFLARQTAVARVWQTSAWFVAEKDERTALHWYLQSILHRPYSVRGWKEVARCCAHACGISRQRIRRKLRRLGDRECKSR